MYLEIPLEIQATKNKIIIFFNKFSSIYRWSFLGHLRLTYSLTIKVNCMQSVYKIWTQIPYLQSLSISDWNILLGPQNLINAIKTDKLNLNLIISTKNNSKNFFRLKT